MEPTPRKIVGLMAVAVTFTVIAQERKAGSAPRPMSTQEAASLDPFRTIIGGTIASAILVGISEMGEPGARLGMGLAVVAVVVATLVNGKPVWDLISGITSGSSPTTPTAPVSSAKATAPTPTTIPTGVAA